MTQIQVYDGDGCNLDRDNPRIHWTESPDDPKASWWQGTYRQARVSILYWSFLDRYFPYHNGNAINISGATRQEAIERLVEYLKSLIWEELE